MPGVSAAADSSASADARVYCSMLYTRYSVSLRRLAAAEELSGPVLALPPLWMYCSRAVLESRPAGGTGNGKLQRVRHSDF